VYFHFLCPLYPTQNPLRYRLYLRPLYLLFFLFLFVFASHSLLPLNGMRRIETFLKRFYYHPAGEMLIPFLLAAKTIWALSRKI
jgi:hypothetical protein